MRRCPEASLVTQKRNGSSVSAAGVGRKQCAERLGVRWMRSKTCQVPEWGFRVVCMAMQTCPGPVPLPASPVWCLGYFLW